MVARLKLKGIDGRAPPGVRLSWKNEKVVDCLRALPPEEHAVAMSAYEFLMASGDSEYAAFVHQHDGVLLCDGCLDVPRMFILKPYLENALFPDLYWCRSWCDSRWSAHPSGRRSCKASFLVKVFSPVLDYTTDKELLQWQYDRWVLSKFTGRWQATKTKGLALKYALADVSETPHYCYLQHLKLDAEVAKCRIVHPPTGNVSWV